MRKKVFSGLLFAAVIALSAGMFAACSTSSESTVEAAAVVSSVQLSATDVVVDAEETTDSFTLEAGLSISEEGGEITMSWSTSSSSVATVEDTSVTDDDGNTTYSASVTVKGEGVAVITASAGNKSATCVVAAAGTVLEDGDSLADALAAASDGDVIGLKAGSYEGGVSTAKGVCVAGAGSGYVSISGGLTLSGESFVSGVTIAAEEEGTDTAGLTVTDADGETVTLRNAEITGFTYGIDADGAECVLAYSSFTDCTWGVSAGNITTILQVSFTDVIYQASLNGVSYVRIGGDPE